MVNPPCCPTDGPPLFWLAGGRDGSGRRPEAPFTARNQAQPKLSDPAQTVAWGEHFPETGELWWAALAALSLVRSQRYNQNPNYVT